MREVIPPALQAAGRGSWHRYRAGLHQLQGIGSKRIVLPVETMNSGHGASEFVENLVFFH